MDSTHYGELTARQTGMLRAILEDKMQQLHDEGAPSHIIQEVKDILDIFGGPDGSQQH